jgi:dTDP-glucose 4,6-dehydratase
VRQGIVLAGGAGFIGSNFVHYWIRQHVGDRVVVLDALTYAGNLMSLEPVRGIQGYSFVRGNVCDTSLIESLLREEGIDTIVHFAAESHVDRLIHGPDVFVESNVIGTQSMLKAGRQVWLEEKSVPAHRFHHVSTDEVYGSLGSARCTTSVVGWSAIISSWCESCARSRMKRFARMQAWGAAIRIHRQGAALGAVA